MTIKRLIPVIQLDKDFQAVKTIKFNKRRYVGDVLNLLKIYNELGVDEVAIWNIDRLTLSNVETLDGLSEMAAEARMPLAFGGMLQCIDDVERVIALGFEKVSFSYSTWCRDDIPEAAVKVLGSSGVQAVINYRKDLFGRYFAFCHRSGGRLERLSVAVNDVVQRGAGEIILQAIDRDGMRVGLDSAVLDELDRGIKVPIVNVGGLRTHAESIEALADKRLSGVASGTCFTFSSERQGVLPSYPSDSSRGL